MPSTSMPDASKTLRRAPIFWIGKKGEKCHLRGGNARERNQGQQKTVATEEYNAFDSADTVKHLGNKCMDTSAKGIFKRAISPKSWQGMIPKVMAVMIKGIKGMTWRCWPHFVWRYLCMLSCCRTKCVFFHPSPFRNFRNVELSKLVLARIFTTLPAYLLSVV